MHEALSPLLAQGHQSLDGLHHKDRLMAFAVHGVGGRPCLFHIQSRPSNQPTQTRRLSLELDFLIKAITFDVKNRHAVTSPLHSLHHARSRARMKGGSSRGAAAAVQPWQQQARCKRSSKCCLSRCSEKRHIALKLTHWVVLTESWRRDKKSHGSRGTESTRTLQQLEAAVRAHRWILWPWMCCGGAAHASKAERSGSGGWGSLKSGFNWLSRGPLMSCERLPRAAVVLCPTS